MHPQTFICFGFYLFIFFYCVEFRKFLADYNTYYTNHAYYTDDSNDYTDYNIVDTDHTDHANDADYGLFLKSISIVNIALTLTILCA